MPILSSQTELATYKIYKMKISTQKYNIFLKLPNFFAEKYKKIAYINYL